MASIASFPNMSTIATPDSSKDLHYQNYIDMEGSNPLLPFSTKNNSGLNIVYLFEMWLPCELKSKKIKTELNLTSPEFIRDSNLYENDYNRMRRVIKKDFNCQTCGERAGVLGRLIDKNGVIFCKNNNRNPAQEIAHSASIRMYNTLRRYSIPLKIRIIRPTEVWLYEKRAGTEPQNTPDWNHYYYYTNKSSDVGINVEQCNIATNQYLFQSMRLLSKFTDRQGALRSLQYIRSIVNNETYADEYKGCVEWLIRLIDKSKMVFRDRDLLDQMEVVAESIFNTCIKKNNDNMVHIGVFSQAQTIVNWCENAYDLASARRMIQKHMNPSTHKRPTAAPKAGAVKKAASLLGEFKNTLMTTNEIVALGAVTLRMRKPFLHTMKPSSVVKYNGHQHETSYTTTSNNNLSVHAAYAELYAEANTNTLGVCGLAQRENNRRTQQIRENTRDSVRDSFYLQNFIYTSLTIEDLINEIKNGNIWNVKVNTEQNCSGCYVANTTLSTDKLADGIPHLWCYENQPYNGRFLGERKNTRLGHGGNRYGGQGVVRQWGDSVTHIYRWQFGQGHDNVLFVLEHAAETIQTKKLPNCCIPAFLNTEYFKSCGSTFEALNSKVDLCIPLMYYGNGLALGIGSSIGNRERGTLSPGGIIKVKVNNQPSWITITNMY